MIPTRSRKSPRRKNASRTTTDAESYPSVIPLYGSSFVGIATAGRHPSLSNRMSRNWRWMPLVVIAGVTMIYIAVNTDRSQSSVTLLDSLNNATTTKTVHDKKFGNHDMNLKLIKNNNNTGKHNDNTATTTTTTGTNFNGFSFFLMGDTPYRDWQVSRLKVQMKEMKDLVRREKDRENTKKDQSVDHDDKSYRNMSFTVHVGDIQKTDLTKCNESAYELASEILKTGPVPTLVVPGDNDYYKCPNRTSSFELFMKYFDSFERNWHKNDWERLGIVRSSEHHELFVFVVEGVLFIGIHLINAPREEEPIELWDKRMNMNTRWVARNIERYMKTHEIRGVILLGHALRSPRTRPFFLNVADHFVNITHRENIPVLYLHGDGHDWDIDTKLSHQLHWSHYRDIQVDQGGLADPVIVQIAPQVDGKTKGLKESNEYQHTFGKGLFLLDRQRGKYEDPKNVKDAFTGK